MIECPSCGHNFKADFGMVSCPKCKHFVVLDVEGNIQQDLTSMGISRPVEEPDFQTTYNENPSQTQSEYAIPDSMEMASPQEDEIYEPQILQEETQAHPAETVVYEDPQAVVDDAVREDQEELAYEEEVEEEPAETVHYQTEEVEEEIVEELIEEPASLEMESAGEYEEESEEEEAVVEDDGWVESGELTTYAPEDMSEIESYGNSELSMAKEGQYLYDLRISGIDTAEIKSMVYDQMVDRRLALNMKGLIKTVKNGVLEVTRLNAIKTSIIVNRLKSLPVSLRWRQNVITQVDPE